MRDSLITLVGKDFERNKYGVMVPALSKKTIFGEIKSITQTEFFSAGQNGIKASYSVTVLIAEYTDEETVEIDGKAYKVYRTYQPSLDLIELYLQELKTNG